MERLSDAIVEVQGLQQQQEKLLRSLAELQCRLSTCHEELLAAPVPTEKAQLSLPGRSPADAPFSGSTSGLSSGVDASPLPRPVSALAKVESRSESSHFEHQECDAEESPLDIVFTNLPQNRLTRTLQHLAECWMTMEEPPRNGPIHRLVSHNWFNGFCVVVIILNAAFLAIVSNQEMQVTIFDAKPYPSLKPIEYSFIVFYILEMLMKFVTHRLYFFVNSDAGWNNFDITLVAFSLNEVIMQELFAGQGNGSLSFMRIGRLLKLTKILCIFRALRFLSQLRLMLTSIVMCLDMLFWCMIMLAFVWWCLSLVLIQGMTVYLEESQHLLSHEEREFIWKSFGSLPAVMFILFQVSTGGNDWGAYFDALAPAGIFYQIMFLGYIIFYTFGLFNILTGMVLENVMVTADKDDEAKAFEYRRTRNAQMREMKRLFHTLDTEKRSGITYAEFKAGMSSSAVRALMETNALDVKDAEMFFGMLEAVSHNNRVSIDTFVDGCMSMRGSAAALDVQILLYETKRVMVDLRSTLDIVKSTQEIMTELPMHVHKGVEAAQHISRQELKDTTAQGAQPWKPEPSRPMKLEFSQEQCSVESVVSSAVLKDSL